MLQQITIENFQQLLSRFTTTELESLLEKSPYFQQAHLLLAKKYQQENNPKFDQQLQLAALYTQDRDLLYRIFNEKVKVAPELIPEVTPPLPHFEEKKEPEIQPGPEEIVLQPETGKIIALEDKPVEPIITEVEVTEEPIELEQVEKTVVEEKEDEQFSVFEPHTFDDWLKAFNKVPVTEVIEEIPASDEAKEDELNKLIMENTSIDYLHDMVEEETHYSKGLDKFIEEQIQKHKYEVVTKPVSENELSPELITETMAKVYEMQKKYSKAIKAYEILALKFPEKNDFFAARINYLKNII